MLREKLGFAAIIVFMCALCASCAVRRPTPCLVGDPGVQVMTIQFVCPNVGASYETTVIKCPWDRHFRMDFVCQLCGHRHYYDIGYLPYPYRWNDYYFYGGYWYSSYYWQRHWSYPPSYGRRLFPPRPPVNPPVKPPRRPPDQNRPPARPPEDSTRDQQIRPPARSPESPAQDPRRSRELRSPAPPAPRYAQPAPSVPRPEPIRVAPPAAPAPSPARGQSPRGSRSR